jgi:hypothetical protein
MRARAELAECEAGLHSREHTTGGNGGARARASSGDGNPSGVADVIPPAAATEYQSVVELLAMLRKRDLDLRLKFKPENRLVVQSRQQIQACEHRRQVLLARYPSLAGEAAVLAAASAGDAAGVARTLDAEKARLAAITAKIRVFESHLEEIGRQFGEQYAIGAKIDGMIRRKEMEEAEYRSLEAKLKEARLDQTLDPSRMPNITIVQQPSEPVKSYDELTLKIVCGLAAGGAALGLGLAFVMELLFNRKVERPMEIQTRLQLPLLLAIPLIRKPYGAPPVLRGDLPPRIGCSGGRHEARGAAASGDVRFISPYARAIRDRIMFNFEVNGINHKPKLIAVTAMSGAAGTSTIAAGLAESFSEIRNTMVLLVDLNSLATHAPPVRDDGIARHTLPKALRLAQDPGFRQRDQNLYHACVAARTDGEGPERFTPLHLRDMMPLMHASKYDYIIFDMPAVHQTSPTLAMAGLMDKVLLVLDAENTTRDGLKWGYSELTRGRADVSCIFNKTRTHGTDWLAGPQ